MYGSINAENYCEPEEDSQWGEKLVRCTEAVFHLQQNIHSGDCDYESFYVNEDMFEGLILINCQHVLGSFCQE